MQYRLWLFLYHLDPFGDRAVPIPTPVELAAQLNMSVRSIYRALQKLSELGLFTIASNYSRSITNGIKNQPLGTKKLRSRNFKGCAKNGNVDDKIGTTVTKQAHKCQNWQNQSPQPKQDNGFTHPQTNTDNIQTLSDIEGSENINSTANSQELVDYWFEDDTYNSSSSAVPIKNEGSIALSIEQLNENDNSDIEAELLDNDRPVSNNKTATNSIALSHWLPSGPWNIANKLDPNFRDWLAKDWIGRYGGTIHQRRADVLSHFQNKPGMLPVRWEQYHSEYLDRFTNAQTRMTNGMSIDPTEQHQLLQHTAAVTNPLPPAMSPVADKKRSPSIEGDRAEAVEIKALKAEEKEKASSSINDRALHNPNSHQEDRIPAKQKSESVIDWSALDRDEEIPENPDAYKLLTPEKIDNPASPSQLRDMFATIAERLKMKPSKSARIKPENKLAKLNLWLQDPILYSEAVQRAKNNGYSIEYNENGRATAIYELEF